MLSIFSHCLGGKTRCELFKNNLSRGLVCQNGLNTAEHKFAQISFVLQLITVKLH